MANAWLEKPVNSNVEAMPVVIAIVFKTLLAIAESVPMKFEISVSKDYTSLLCRSIMKIKSAFQCKMYLYCSLLLMAPAHCFTERQLIYFFF